MKKIILAMVGLFLGVPSPSFADQNCADVNCNAPLNEINIHNKNTDIFGKFFKNKNDVINFIKTAIPGFINTKKMESLYDCCSFEETHETIMALKGLIAKLRDIATNLGVSEDEFLAALEGKFPEQADSSNDEDQQEAILNLFVSDPTSGEKIFSTESSIN